MTRNLGTTTLEVSTTAHADSHFNRKIVLHNLEAFLQSKGYTVTRCETREDGRGSPISVRVRTRQAASLRRASLDVDVSIVDHRDAHFSAKIVFRGLEKALSSRGVTVETCETREHGEGTPIAVRVNL